VLAGLALAGTLRADQIVVKGVNHPSARIVGLEGGQIRFRGEGGTMRSAWLNEVDLVQVDRGGAFVDLNQAEEFMAGGEPERAIARYRRVQKLADDFWSDLVAARLVRACNAAAQLDDATVQWIRLLRAKGTGPAAASRLLPDAIPAQRDGKVTRAIEQVESALALNPPDAERMVLELYRFELLRRIGDEQAGPAAERVASLAIPPAARSDRLYAVQLAALAELLRRGNTTAALKAVDLAMTDAPESVLPALLMLKGEALLAAGQQPEEQMRAAWAFMRVVIHFPEDRLVPHALQGAAAAAERYGRVDQAVALLEQCLSLRQTTESTRQSAEAELRRLREGGPTTGRSGG
jgi:tetratricopeptide (TPR) repeat protein